MRDRSRLPGQTSKVNNAHYEKDLRYTIKLCSWLLKPIGIWNLMQDHSSLSEKMVSIVLIVVCLSLLCFVLIPSGVHTIFREKDINIKIKLFGPVGFCLTNTIKYCYLGMHGVAFGRCIRHIEEDWRLVSDQDHREIMLRNALMGRKLTTISVFFLYIGGLSYHTIVPLYSNQGEVNKNFTQVRLIYPGYDMLFFDPAASPTFEILFLTHCVFALVTYNITTSACSLAAIYVTHACGQLQILMIQLSDLVDGKRSKKTTVQIRLKTIVKHHIQVMRFSTSVEEVLRQICLWELGTSTLTICLLEYYCMTEWQNSDGVAIFTYFILLLSFSFNIFIFCYIGELLVEQYSEIGLAVYGINWYDLSGNKAVDLKLIIAMSRNPIKLTAGKIFTLSFHTFGAVLRTSVAYLNILRTVTQ